MGPAFVFLSQNIPDRLRNGAINGSRVQYCEVGECGADPSNPAGQVSERTRTCGQHFQPFPATSAKLELRSSCDYEVYVDASTTAGFNTSLKLRPLFVAGHQRGKNTRTSTSYCVELNSARMQSCQMTRLKRVRPT